MQNLENDNKSVSVNVAVSDGKVKTRSEFAKIDGARVIRSILTKIFLSRFN